MQLCVCIGLALIASIVKADVSHLPLSKYLPPVPAKEELVIHAQSSNAVTAASNIGSLQYKPVEQQSGLQPLQQQNTLQYQSPQPQQQQQNIAQYQLQQLPLQEAQNDFLRYSKTPFAQVESIRPSIHLASFSIQSVEPVHQVLNGLHHGSTHNQHVSNIAALMQHATSVSSQSTVYGAPAISAIQTNPVQTSNLEVATNTQQSLASTQLQASNTGAQTLTQVYGSPATTVSQAANVATTGSITNTPTNNGYEYQGLSAAPAVIEATVQQIQSTPAVQAVPTGSIEQQTVQAATNGGYAPSGPSIAPAIEISVQQVPSKPVLQNVAHVTTNLVQQQSATVHNAANGGYTSSSIPAAPAFEISTPQIHTIPATQQTVQISAGSIQQQGATVHTTSNGGYSSSAVSVAPAVELSQPQSYYVPAIQDNSIGSTLTQQVQVQQQSNIPAQPTIAVNQETPSVPEQTYGLPEATIIAQALSVPITQTQNIVTTASSTPASSGTYAAPPQLTSSYIPPAQSSPASYATAPQLSFTSTTSGQTQGSATITQQQSYSPPNLVQQAPQTYTVQAQQSYFTPPLPVPQYSQPSSTTQSYTTTNQQNQVPNYAIPISVQLQQNYAPPAALPQTTSYQQSYTVPNIATQYQTQPAAPVQQVQSINYATSSQAPSGTYNYAAPINVPTSSNQLVNAAPQTFAVEQTPIVLQEYNAPAIPQTAALETVPVNQVPTGTTASLVPTQNLSPNLISAPTISGAVNPISVTISNANSASNQNGGTEYAANGGYVYRRNK